MFTGVTVFATAGGSSSNPLGKRCGYQQAWKKPVYVNKNQIFKLPPFNHINPLFSVVRHQLTEMNFCISHCNNHKNMTDAKFESDSISSFGYVTSQCSLSRREVVSEFGYLSWKIVFMSRIVLFNQH